MDIFTDGGERGRHATSHNQAERMRGLGVTQRHAVLRVSMQAKQYKKILHCQRRGGIIRHTANARLQETTRRHGRVFHVEIRDFGEVLLHVVTHLVEILGAHRNVAFQLVRPLAERVSRFVTDTLQVTHQQRAIGIAVGVSPNREPLARQGPIQFVVLPLLLARELLHRSNHTIAAYNEIRIVERLELEKVLRSHVTHMIVLVESGNTLNIDHTSKGTTN